MTLSGPAVGRAGTKLLYDTARFKAPYPLAFKSDQAIAPRLIAAGLLAVDPNDRFLVSLTANGQAFLDRLMRCE